MAFVVEMVGGVEGASWHFCCGALVWEQILQLGRENGWQPLGTSPDTVWKRLWDEYEDLRATTSATSGARIYPQWMRLVLPTPWREPPSNRFPRFRRVRYFFGRG